MAENTNPRRREHEIVVQELKGELLIYNLKTNKQFCLNSTSALIWNLCDGRHSVADIGKELSRKTKQPVTAELVWIALDQLRENDLLAENIEIAFAGLSRREALKKAGLATMLALPVILSVTAPEAAHAASCIADNAFFTLNSTNTNDCSVPANYNRCCSKSIKFASTDGVSTVTCVCGVIVIL